MLNHCAYIMPFEFFLIIIKMNVTHHCVKIMKLNHIKHSQSWKNRGNKDLNGL